jgi:hypothetical protein
MVDIKNYIFSLSYNFNKLYFILFLKNYILFLTNYILFLISLFVSLRKNIKNI